MTDDKKIPNEDFEELDFESQCKIVFTMPLARKADLIVRSQEPQRLVHSLAAQELYLMIREMDGTNVPELLQFANFDQLQFLSDLECWKNDLIDPHGFVKWIEYLEAAGEEKLLMWLLKTDVNVLIVGFQRCMQVLKPFHEEVVDDIIGDKPYFTIDGLYYILIDEENSKTIKHCLDLLFEEAKHEYYNLLEGILAEADTIVEGEAYDLRQVRLTEKGFPEKEQSARIYRRITREEWENNSSRRRTEGNVSAHADVMSHYPVLWKEERVFFDEVLGVLVQTMPESARDVYQELVALCNKIIAADQLDNFSEKQVKKALAQARHILTIALEDLSTGDITRARDILARSWIEYLFRWGFSCILDVRDAGERIIKSYWDFTPVQLYAFLDEPYGPCLRGIMKTYPELYDPVSAVDTISLLRDFSKIKDLLQVRRRLKSIASALQLVSSQLCTGWDRVFDVATHEEDITDTVSEVKLSTVILTLFASYVLLGKPLMKPLSIAQVKQFINKAFVGTHGSEEVRSIDPVLQASFVRYIHEHVREYDEEAIKFLKEYFDVCFMRGEEELGMIDARMSLQQEFVSCLLISPAKKR